MSKKSHPGDGTRNSGVKGNRPEFDKLFNGSPEQLDSYTNSERSLLDRLRKATEAFSKK